MSYDQLDRISQQRKEIRKIANEEYNRQSRNRLKRIIESKIRTTMIGAIANVEQYFGHLWGQGKHDGQLTRVELELAEIKDRLRTAILNQGNSQLRAAMSEIDQYDISWNRYQYDLTEDSSKVYGLREDNSPKRARYGYNEDGSLKLRGNE